MLKLLWKLHKKKPENKSNHTKIVNIVLILQELDSKRMKLS